jgi:uncharacterized protein
MFDALFDAIDKHDVDRLAKLLATGEDPNKPVVSNENFSPLQIAVWELEALSEAEPGGSIDAVVLLLRYGAEVDGRAVRITTPLLTAVNSNNMECVRILLAAGADPNVRGEEGDSPLRLCAQGRLLEMARLLLRCGADKTMNEAGGAAAMNALGYAAYELDVDMVKLLLAHGADPSVRDYDRMTPLERLRRFPHTALPEDPLAQQRYQEIRRLLGGT